VSNLVFAPTTADGVPSVHLHSAANDAVADALVFTDVRIQSDVGGPGLVVVPREDPAFVLGSGVDSDLGLPVDVAVESDGIFVLDALRDDVHVLDRAGTPLSFFGGEGTGVGQFDGPIGIALDPSNRLWAANDRVQVLAMDGFQLSHVFTIDLSRLPIDFQSGPLARGARPCPHPRFVSP